jgi:hypothetical protein
VIKLPKWAKVYLEDNECPGCGAKLSESEIVSVGIRKASDGKPRLCFDSMCNECDQKCSTTLVTSFDLEAEQIAAEILAAYGGESMIEIVSGRKMLPPGRAAEEFEKDFESLKRFMAQNDSFEEFMRHCGLSDREINNP